MINIEQFIADIKGMTVLELADLVKAIEDEFGANQGNGSRRRGS